MQRVALALAAASLVACALAMPGPFVALGSGIAAIGCGAIGYGRRDAPGASRLVAAAAIAIGSLGFLLALLRVVLVVVAIAHLEGLLGV
jgi:hypothetical protein